MQPTRICLFNVYATFGLRSKAAPNMVNKQYAFISWKQSWTSKLEIGTDGGGTLVAYAYIKESTDSYTVSMPEKILIYLKRGCMESLGNDDVPIFLACK